MMFCSSCSFFSGDDNKVSYKFEDVAVVKKTCNDDLNAAKNNKYDNLSFDDIEVYNGFPDVINCYEGNDYCNDTTIDECLRIVDKKIDECENLLGVKVNKDYFMVEFTNNDVGKFTENYSDLVKKIKNDSFNFNQYCFCSCEYDSVCERYEADLNATDLKDADLKDADLKDADLKDADLKDADLKDADLKDADLKDADLKDADLKDADLKDADLKDADKYDFDGHSYRYKDNDDHTDVDIYFNKLEDKDYDVRSSTKNLEKVYYKYSKNKEIFNDKYKLKDGNVVSVKEAMDYAQNLLNSKDSLFHNKFNYEVLKVVVSEIADNSYCMNIVLRRNFNGVFVDASMEYYDECKVSSDKMKNQFIDDVSVCLVGKDSYQSIRVFSNRIRKKTDSIDNCITLDSALNIISNNIGSDSYNVSSVDMSYLCLYKESNKHCYTLTPVWKVVACDKDKNIACFYVDITNGNFDSMIFKNYDYSS